MPHSLKDGNEKLLIEEEGQIGRIVWDFDSRHFFYRKRKDEIHLYHYSIETGEEGALLADLKGLDLHSVSPDGEYWAFQSRRQTDMRIWVLEDFLPESREQIASR